MTGGGSAVADSSSTKGRLLRLNARCPACGAPPAIRVTEAAVSDARFHAADKALATYQCQRRRCGTVYELRASAYHEAA